MAMHSIEAIEHHQRALPDELQTAGFHVTAKSSWQRADVEVQVRSAPRLKSKGDGDVNKSVGVEMFFASEGPTFRFY